MLDMFRGDAFSVTQLTAAILKAPYKPGRIAQLGLFASSGVRTTSVVVEEKDGQLSLIPVTPRGGVSDSLGNAKRTARSFLIPHLQRESMILADEVQNVRAFGSEDATQSVEALVNERLATLRAMHEVTLEHQRIGAIKGIILDADGNTVYNLFTEFDVSQQAAVIVTDHDSDTFGATRDSIQAAQRLIEDELGAEPVSGYRAFCGRDFFDLLRRDAGIEQTLRYADPMALLQNQANSRVFSYGGVTWEEYRGRTGGTPFVADSEAYMFPEGSSIFRTYFAPADFVETVNTMGLPIYAKQVIDPELQRWVKLHTQSNPLSLCTRPRAVVKLTLTT